MIPPDALHRLLASITNSILGSVAPTAGELDADDRDDQRTALSDFAHHHELDLQDLATLVRVASGEAVLGYPGTARSAR